MAREARRIVRWLSAMFSTLSVKDAAIPPPDPECAIRYVLSDPADEARPRTLITQLGEPPANVDVILSSVAAACRLRGEFPLIVMSELRPDLIAASDTPIEFVPTLYHLPVGPDDYGRYLRRRWALLLAKWNVGKQVDLGTGFEEFLEAELAGAASTGIRPSPDGNRADHSP